MERLTYPPLIPPTNSKPLMDLESWSETDAEKRQIERINQTSAPQAREGYDCPICHNKEFVVCLDENSTRRLHACHCIDIRRNLARLRKSGLLDLYQRCQFDTYRVSEAWQKEALERAKAFEGTRSDAWFFIAGQSGCGKTHLCTAIAGNLVRSGCDVQVLRWVEFAAKAKATITDVTAYQQLIQPLKQCDVLYLDDFLKVQHGQTPTSADVRLAFEVLDSRYNATSKPVLISSEFSLRQLAHIDEALAGRIAERSRGFAVQIHNAEGRNYRFK